jgi:hypothetical protein
MRYLISLFIAFSLVFVSCKHNEGPTNEYKNAKVHESDRVAKERKNANKQAIKQAKKNMRAAKKIRRKKSRAWNKKGSYG